MKIEQMVLQGRHVKLVPMNEMHISPLWEIGNDQSIWRWSPSKIACRDDMAAYVRAALADQAKGDALPFVTVDLATETVVGSTRFGNLDVANRRTEIGWTWIAPKWQRTAVNTEAKLLMLQQAFDNWGCIRVELKTDALNTQSRSAIARIGAVEEGIFRNHMITHSGRFRDSVYFSIIESEWPVVSDRLSQKLDEYAG